MHTCTGQILRLRPTADAAGRARDALDTFCDGLTESEVVDLRLITTELVTNAVVHPQRADSGWAAQIVLVIQRTSAGMRVEVRDSDAAAMPVVQPSLAPSESGMGLRMVQQLASDWGSYVLPEGEGKVVWFELDTWSQDLSAEG